MDGRAPWASIRAMPRTRPEEPTGSAPDPGPAAGDPTEPDPPFEASIERLESLVEELERDDLDLERALAAFEEGVRLSRSLDRQLGRAEQHIETLLQESGGLTTQPMDPPDESDS